MNKRKIDFMYNIENTWISGMSLTSEHIIAIRSSRFTLNNAFVHIDNHREAWLKNVKLYNISHDIKLLLKRNEINKLYGYYSAKGKVIIPFDLRRVKRYFKITIGVGSTKTQIDKRETIKKRDVERRGGYDE